MGAIPEKPQSSPGTPGCRAADKKIFSRTKSEAGADKKGDPTR